MKITDKTQGMNTTQQLTFSERKKRKYIFRPKLCLNAFLGKYVEASVCYKLEKPYYYQ